MSDERHIIDRFVEVYYPRFPDSFHEEDGEWRVSPDIFDRLRGHIAKYGWQRPDGPATGDEMFGRPLSVDAALPANSIVYDRPRPRVRAHPTDDEPRA